MAGLGQRREEKGCIKEGCVCRCTQEAMGGDEINFPILTVSK